MTDSTTSPSQGVASYDRPSTGAILLLVSIAMYVFGWILAGAYDWMNFTLAMPWLLVHVAIWIMMAITLFYVADDEREEPHGVRVMSYVMLVATLLLFITSITPVQAQISEVTNSVNSDSGVVVIPEGATALNFDCDGDIANGSYPSRAANLVSPASGPSMAGMDAEELFEEICNRMSNGEVQRAFYPGAMVPEQVLYGDSLSSSQLNEWPAALAADDSLSEAVMKRLSLVSFDAEWVSQDALGGEDYKILTIDPASSEERPVIVTMANFNMPAGGMSLWKLTPVSYGDSPLDEVASSFFEPSLGIFFIPRGMDVDARELDGELDLGELFGNEEEPDQAMDTTTTTSVAPDGTVTSTSTAPDGAVTTTVTSLDGSSTTTTTGPDGTVTTTTEGAGGTTTTVQSGCPGDCGGTTPTTTPECTSNCGGGTTTTTQVTTTTCPSCGTTTTTRPPTTTTTNPPTTTTTQPPTTTTTTVPEELSIKPWLQLIESTSTYKKYKLVHYSQPIGNICSYSLPIGSNGKVFTISENSNGGMIYDSGSQKLYVNVTAYGCNGGSVTRKTQSIDPFSGGY